MEYKRKDIYAALAGQYIGQMFIIMEVGDGTVKCFVIPTNTVHHIPESAFESGISGGLLDKMDVMEDEHFEFIEKQYEEHIKEHSGGHNPVRSSEVR